MFAQGENINLSTFTACPTIIARNASDHLFFIISQIDIVDSRKNTDRLASDNDW